MTREFSVSCLLCCELEFKYISPVWAFIYLTHIHASLGSRTKIMALLAFGFKSKQFNRKTHAEVCAPAENKWTAS